MRNLDREKTLLQEVGELPLSWRYSLRELWEIVTELGIDPDEAVTCGATLVVQKKGDT